MRIKYTLLITAILASFGSGQLVAQEGKVNKANKEFGRYDYIDARAIYLKVVESGYGSAQLYENLGDTYYWNSDYTNAAKWYGKLLDEFPNDTDPVYFYRGAQTFKSVNEMAKSEEYMQMYLSKRGDDGLLDPSITNYVQYDATLEKVAMNSSFSDFAPTFLGKNIVYASTKPGGEGSKTHNWTGQPFPDIYIGYTDEQGNITSASPILGDVNTKFDESTSTFSKDGKTMYFTRNNFIDGKKGRDKNKTVNLKIYKATLNSDNQWTNIIELPFNGDDYSVAHPALSPDGKRLYFAAEFPGQGEGMSDIYYVDILEGDTYGEPQNLGKEINTSARESFPFISESNVLYFASDGRGGSGGFDVFRAELNDAGNYTNVTNLGAPVNSAKDDFGFIMNEETKIGYVASNRDGDQGSIDDDIYRVVEVCEITIGGKVYNQLTGLPLFGALVSIADENNQVVDTFTTGADGLYEFMADCDKQYSIRASLINFVPHEEMIQTPDKTSSMDVPMPLMPIDPCPENDLGCKLKLLPIYFDFDRYNIRPDAAVELAKIQKAMEEYPELVIHIESHTDSRGSDTYNAELSEKRAQATLEWLVKQGISRNRLSAKGYGESRLLNNCANGVECTEEEHQLNRRSMFIIQN